MNSAIFVCGNVNNYCLRDTFFPDTTNSSPSFPGALLQWDSIQMAYFYIARHITYRIWLYYTTFIKLLHYRKIECFWNIKFNRWVSMRTCILPGFYNVCLFVLDGIIV